jgi:hypothetical protein
VSDFNIGPVAWLERGEWYDRPRRQCSNGGKLEGKINTLNKMCDFSAKKFKLLA